MSERRRVVAPVTPAATRGERGRPRRKAIGTVATSMQNSAVPASICANPIGSADLAVQTRQLDRLYEGEAELLAERQKLLEERPGVGEQYRLAPGHGVGARGARAAHEERRRGGESARGTRGGGLGAAVDYSPCLRQLVR